MNENKIILNIDLRELFNCSEGDSVESTIRKIIIDDIKKEVIKDVKEKLYSQLESMMIKEFNEEARRRIPILIEEFLDKKYDIVTCWGCKERTTTFRNEFLTTLKKELYYKPENFDSKKNYFTRAIDDFTENLVKQFRSDFDAKVKENYLREAYTYALQKVAKAWQLTAKELEV